MDAWDELRAQRDELERRLLELEQAVGEQRLRLVGQDGSDLAASVEALLVRLGAVNAELAALRSPSPISSQ